MDFQCLCVDAFGADPGRRRRRRPFGLRRAFVAGMALFIVASLACALAPNAVVLIAFRAIQGIGAAIMVPGSLAIIAKAYPKKERGRASASGRPPRR